MVPQYASVFDAVLREARRRSIPLAALAVTLFSVGIVQAAGGQGEIAGRTGDQHASVSEGTGSSGHPSPRQVEFGSLQPAATITSPSPGSVVTPGTVVTVSGSASSPNGLLAAVQYQIVPSDVVSVTLGDQFEAGWLPATVMTATAANGVWAAAWSVPTSTLATTYTVAARAIDTDGSPDTVTQTAATLLKVVTPRVDANKLAYLPAIQVSYRIGVETIEPVVKNGQFISNRDPWIVTPGALGGSFVSSGPFTGGAALLGSPSFRCDQVPKDAYSQIAQRITVPDKASVRLKFDWRMQTRDFVQTLQTNRPVDSLDVYVIDATTADPPTGDIAGQSPLLRDGRPPTSATLNCTDPEVTIAKSADLDITSKRGKSVWIIFQVWNRIDNNLNTFVYIDNVVVE